MTNDNPPPPQIRQRVPVRTLATRHRPRIVEHLLTLSPRDRYLRFGHAASDEQIARYVAQIDFDRDDVFGIFNRKLKLVAMAHLAFVDGSAGSRGFAEFGVSVSQHARGRGWGARLFDRAVLEARNHGVDVLVIHALTENGAMLHIARKAGAKVENDGPDALARLKLPQEDFGSHVEAIVEDQVAQIDYSLKLQARRFDRWWQLLRFIPVPTRRDVPGPAGTEPPAPPV